MYNAIKVILFSCLFFITTAAAAQAFETTQLTLQNNPFATSSARVALQAPDAVIDDGNDESSNEGEESQPAPEGKPAPEELPKARVHVIKSGENLSDIAILYQTTWNRIFAKNEVITNPDIVTVGMTLTIPEEDEVLPERSFVSAAPTAQAVTTTPQTASAPVRPVYAASAGNTYAAGYCTWYAKNRRPDLPNMLGNASSWVASAAARGYATGTAPRVGAIGQQGNHVVYVEAVHPNGTVSISEMNYGGGLFVVHHRTVAAGNFIYIY